MTDKTLDPCGSDSSTEFCQRKVWVRGMIKGASYSGCEGWSSWVIREIRFRCDADKVAEAKTRAARRIEATSGTYTMRSVAWQQNQQTTGRRSGASGS